MAELSAGEEDLSARSVRGFRYVRNFLRVLRKLPHCARENDPTGKRKLFLAQYAGLVLVSLFDPVMQSLNGIKKLSQVKKLQQRLGGGRVSLGSLSEAVRVFDPTMLEPLIQDLFEQLPEPQRPHPDAQELIPETLLRQLQLVDGTVLQALPQIVAASGGQHANWRMHLQFSVWDAMPVHARITDDDPGESVDERDALARDLQAGRCYVMDRGYERYQLMNQIVQAKSDYVLRAQHRPATVVQSVPLSTAALQAGVQVDEEVELGTGSRRVTHRVRRLVIQPPQGIAGRKRTDRHHSDQIVLLTNLMTVPAEVIGAVYQLRWSIELFFRFFKHVLGCQHLLSHKQVGIEIQVYCALIACLLLALCTGASTGISGFRIVALYLRGLADEEDCLAMLRDEMASQSRRKKST